MIQEFGHASCAEVFCPATRLILLVFVIQRTGNRMMHVVGLIGDIQGGESELIDGSLFVFIGASEAESRRKIGKNRRCLGKGPAIVHLENRDGKVETLWGKMFRE